MTCLASKKMQEARLAFFVLEEALETPKLLLMLNRRPVEPSWAKAPSMPRA